MPVLPGAGHLQGPAAHNPRPVVVSAGNTHRQHAAVMVLGATPLKSSRPITSNLDTLCYYTTKNIYRLLLFIIYLVPIIGGCSPSWHFFKV